MNNKLSSMIESTAITNFVLVDAQLDSQIYAYALDATLFSSGNLSLADNYSQLRHNRNKGKAAGLEIAELPRKQMQLANLNPGKNGIECT